MANFDESIHLSPMMNTYPSNGESKYHMQPMMNTYPSNTESKYHLQPMMNTYPSKSESKYHLQPMMNTYPSKSESKYHPQPMMNTYPSKPNKKPVPTSDESALRKKLVEIHAHDGGGAFDFDTEPLLASIQGILIHVAPGVDFTSVTNNVEKFPTIIQPTGPDGIADTLPYLLHKIICVLNCKCSGGDGHDGHALALELLQLLANYTWEAKIVIVLAAFVVEFGHYSLVSTLYKSNSLAGLLAVVKQIPGGNNEISDVMRSKIDTIIRLIKISMEVTRLIANLSSFPSKYISGDAEPMVVALNQVPIAVYWMIRVIIACASEHSQILGHSEITTSYTETWNISSLEKKITTIQITFTTQLDLCYTYIEETKQKQYYEKLRGMFSQTTIFADNQKILQAIINIKDVMRPLSRGLDLTTMIGLEALKRKTVLLLISDLTISYEEIAIISRFYKESRTRTEYEILWLPIVENMEQIEAYEEKFEELKIKMPWYTLVHPKLLKLGFVRYVKSEWRYTKKPIMVALDQRGKVVHQNALHMMMTWGNAGHPFTYRRELELWSRKEWSLTLLVEDIDINISTWIRDNKVICLYGGEDYEWIEEFIERAMNVANEANIELEMVYVGKKNTTEEHMTKVSEIIVGRSHVWQNSTSGYFWKRIESMMHSKVQLGAVVATAKGSGGDQVLAELLYMMTVGDSDKGWAMISQGAGAGAGAGSGAEQIARASGNAMLKAFEDFEMWSTRVEIEGFTSALHGYLAGRSNKDHDCTPLLLPGGEDIPGIVLCAECGQPMERRVIFVCPTARLIGI